MRTLLLLLFVLCSCNGVGGPTLDCETVSRRLVDDCKLTFGVSSGACAGLYTEAELETRSYALNTRICEAVEPTGDEQCYLTASCTLIESGACADGSDSMRDPACVQTCSEQLGSCLETCRGLASADVCEGCVLDCNRTNDGCAGDC